MMRLDRKGLEVVLREMDARLETEADLILVGGAAVILLAEGPRVTSDLDAMWTDDLDQLENAAASISSIHFSRRSDPFEICLPGDWRDRLVRHPIAGLSRLRVHSPAPEDLAVMKVFRFGPKDADDIARLASRPGFDRSRFRAGFENAVVATIGDPRWHAQSFEMLWNRLYPEQPLSRNELLPR